MLLAVEDGWNASLDSSDIHKAHIDKKDSLTLSEETFLLSSLTNSNILIADVKCYASEHILLRNNNHIQKLGSKNNALEELSNFLAEPLTYEEKAHVIYSQDYISGLSAAGIPFAPNEDTDISFRQIVKKELLAEDNLTLWESMKNEWRTLYHQVPNDKKPTVKTSHFSELSDLKEIKLYHVDTRKYQDYTSLFLNFLNSLEIRNGNLDLPDDHKKNQYITASSNLDAIKLNNKLIIYTKSEQRTGDYGRLDFDDVELIEFFASSNLSKELTQLKSRFNHKPDIDCSIYSGLYSSYFSVRFNQSLKTNTLPLVNTLVDELLGLVLCFNRPLRHYGCTFFLPFRLREGELNTPPKSHHFSKLADDNNRVETHLKNPIDRLNHTSNEYDAFLYLNPVVRKQLYPTDFDVKNKNSGVNTKVYQYQPWKDADQKNWEAIALNYPKYCSNWNKFDAAKLDARSTFQKRDHWNLYIREKNRTL